MNKKKLVTDFHEHDAVLTVSYSWLFSLFLLYL